VARVQFKPTYNEDNLATDHWLSTDAKFEAAYQRAIDMGLAVSTTVKWRAHVACWAARRGAKLGGAFVECGVNRGFLSRVIIEYLGDVPNFYLLDTYKGFDESTLSAKQIASLKAWHIEAGKTGDWRNGMYEECYEDVVRSFADKPQVKIVRGTVPDTLSQVTEDKIAYLSIDMNCAAPEIAALDYFWPKLVPGATVVLDDYGWTGHTEQRDAFDEWSLKNSVPLLSLPTGQGLLVKS
jgi:hypothetical protein